MWTRFKCWLLHRATWGFPELMESPVSGCGVSSCYKHRNRSWWTCHKKGCPMFLRPRWKKESPDGE